jgi:hypothetical protein
MNNGDLALAILMALACFYVGSHLHWAQFSPEITAQINQRTVYTCPGVGEQENIRGYLGCEFLRVENKTQLVYGQQFWGIYWG